MQAGGDMTLPLPLPSEAQSPSARLLRETHLECSEAIEEYLTANELFGIEWDRARGLVGDAKGDLPRLPGLLKDKHHRFLARFLKRLPAGFTSVDASRPWMCYWVINSLRTLDIEIDLSHALVETLTPCQDAGGGFGGGQGQYSHLATTYAAVLALISSGMPPSAVRFVDRHELTEWLGRLKQPNGAFAMAEGGEADVRAVYIVLVLLTLFSLPDSLPESSLVARAAGHTTFRSGVAAYIGACQSYEGGIGCNPSTEAHGAYTFCGVAALCLLQPDQSPGLLLRQHLDLDALLQWIAWRQEDISGGLAGRTNKLVDNCYSHWIGGCWPLMENAFEGTPELFNRSALSLYILACGQAPYGGLRDKPSKDSDAYHSCYGLAGLSMTMYHWKHEHGDWICTPLHSPVSKDGQVEIFLQPLHPVYLVPLDKLVAVREFFQARPLVS